MSITGSEATNTNSVVQRWGNVFDRLYDPATYTGVYAERFRSGPGINNDADVKLHHHVSSFEGNTNTGTNEHIRDIKYITRPNLNRDRSSPASPMGRAAAKARARYEASERALLNAFSPQAVQNATNLPTVFILPADANSSTYGVGLGVGLHSSSTMVSPRSSSKPATTPIPPSRPLDTNVLLQLLFQYYCRFGRTSGMSDEGDTLDSFNFAKFTRECPGLLDRSANLNSGAVAERQILTPTEVDLIFVKCRTKGARRLHYSQWLDALSAMATVKYNEIDDPAAAFSLFLTTHVFTNPAAIGISQAIRSGLIAVETAGSPRSTSRRSSRGGSVAEDRRSSSPHNYGMSVAGTDAGRFSATAAALGRSPAAVRGHRLAPEVNGPAPSLQSPPVPVSTMTFPSSPSGNNNPIVSSSSSSSATPSSSSSVSLPPEFQNIPGMAEAIRAAAEALTKAKLGSSTIPSNETNVSTTDNNNTANNEPSINPPETGSVRSERSERTANSSLGPAALHLHASYPTAPADVFELIARKAVEIQIQQARVGTNNFPSVEIPLSPSNTRNPFTGTSTSFNSSSSPRSSRPWSPNSLRKGPSAAESFGINPNDTLTVHAIPTTGTTLDSLDGVEHLHQKHSPTGSRRGHSTLGSPDFRPTQAGEANGPDSVFARLTDPHQYTGVYRRAYLDGGYSTMNHSGEIGVTSSKTDYKGHTNTGSNQVVHDIRHTLRSNLAKGKHFKP